jgi:RNA polymerase sigma-70 factor (ECF subfamily)
MLTVKRDAIQPELNDEILAVRIAQHDTAALEMVYDRFASRVFSLASMLLDREEAERVVLEMFSRLWLEIDQFISLSGSLQDWLLDLTRATILTEVKLHKGQPTQYFVDATNRWLSEATDQMTKNREKFHKPNSGHKVWQALRDLTSEQRCSIVLAYYGGFKQKEIAELLNWQLSDVKQNINHGLQRLRDSVKPGLVLERG